MNNLKKASSAEKIIEIEEEGIKWNDGRRIVDLGVLAEGLGVCSKSGCDSLLDLKNITNETRIGLCSILWVACEECNQINRVPTGKSHLSEKQRPIYDVNSKTAEAMLHSGVSQRATTRFLSTLNIPPPSRTLLKRREREVGPTIETVAGETCKRAMHLEGMLTDTGDDTFGPEAVDLVASYDMGWQRRSSGRAYNSKSGHGVLIGEATGKILNYGTRIVGCKQCDVNAKTGRNKMHDCRMNWNGSAKAMEADLAVELINTSTTTEYRVGTIISDEDATTMAKVRQFVDHAVSKRSDMNHIRKTLGNMLYELKNSKGYKILSTKVIDYVTKCFGYAIHQKKSDAEAVRKALLNVLPHIHGEHENCGPSWCRFLTDPNRKYKSLPYGRCLNDAKLRVDLDKIFDCYAAMSEKLSHISSSNPNESFNNMVAAKAPKNCHYSNSESLDFRVASSVCQKNVGENYVSLVNEKIGLSPGKIAIKEAEKTDDEFLKRKERESKKKFKKRRIELKQLRNIGNKQKEVREGTTYKTSVCLFGIDDVDVEEIPTPSPPPALVNLTVEEVSNATYCVFDLETTSLFDDCDIVQLSAVTLDGEHSFDQFIFAQQNICPSASKVNGFTKKGTSLFHNGTLVDSVDIRHALEEFSNWLESLNDEIVLIGHNIKSFDTKHFLRTVKINKMGLDFGMIVGYIDTLPLFKQLFPLEQSHKQTAIFKRVIGGEHNAHNALDDVKALAQILRQLSVATAVSINFSMTASSASEYYDQLQRKKDNTGTFRELRENNVLSKGMIDKAAESGLRYRHLKVAFQRDGEDGVRAIFSEKYNGKARVTAQKKIIKTVSEFLKFSSL